MSKCESFVEKIGKVNAELLGFVTDDDTNVTFKVYEPKVAEYKVAMKARNEAFVEALGAKAPLRGQINTLLRKRGEWDDERETQYNDLAKDLLAMERKLKQGGISLVKAKKIALDMKETRIKLQNMLGDRSSLDNMTAEGQADNAHFNMLLVQSFVYIDKDGNEVKYFKDLDDYMMRSTSVIANTAAQKLASMLYSVGENAEKQLPENKFLLKYKFVDDKLRLINKEGKLVDSEGRLVNEEGFYINEQGLKVDKYGNLLDENGEYIVDVKPFTDEDGNDIVEEQHGSEDVAPVIPAVTPTTE
jgi:hypothetical protein